MDYIDEDRRYHILANVFDDSTSSSTAADKIASLATSPIDVDIDGLWTLITCCAMKLPKQQGKLVDVLVHLSKLPDAKTSDGRPITKYGMQVWKDLPTLGWYLRELLDNVEDFCPCFPHELIGEGKKEQQDVVSEYANLHRFLALLMATKEPVFNYSWFALIVLREALEVSPARRIAGTSLDADVLSAAEWIKVLGGEIYQWKEQFSDRLGRERDLWKGPPVYGFSKERWTFWRQRFGEVARMDEDELGERARTAAKEAEGMMVEIENREVSH